MGAKVASLRDPAKNIRRRETSSLLRATAAWAAHLEHLGHLERKLASAASAMADDPSDEIRRLVGRSPRLEDTRRQERFRTALEAILHYQTVYEDISELRVAQVPFDAKDDIRTSLQLGAVFAIGALLSKAAEAQTILESIVHHRYDKLFRDYFWNARADFGGIFNRLPTDLASWVALNGRFTALTAWYEHAKEIEINTLAHENFDPTISVGDAVQITLMKRNFAFWMTDFSGSAAISHLELTSQLHASARGSLADPGAHQTER